MDFWKFCEKVSGCVGQKIVIQYCQLVYDMYMENKTVGEVAEAFKMALPPSYFKGN